MKTHLFRTLLGVIAIAGLGTVAVRAEDASPQAKRLIAMIDFSKTAKDQAKIAFAPVLERFKKQGIPEEGIKEIREAAERFFAKTFDGKVQLRGLQKRKYRVRDYVNNRDLGTVVGPVAILELSIDKHLLLEAVPN